MQILQKKMAFAGCLLFSVGLFTGIWTAAATTGMVSVPIPHLSLAAHLNGLLGGLWLIAVAGTFSFLSYTAVQLTRLYWMVLISTWGNWLITLIASFLGVTGLQFNHDPANNVIAFLLQVVVVIPALVGTVYWARGFCECSKNRT